MNIPFYHINAFTSHTFKGNPAGVCILDNWLEDSLLQNIAMENNLSETAFLVRQDDTHEIRWFSPTVEIDLCGHATLAAGFVLANFRDFISAKLRFISPISGELSVLKEGDRLTLDFPARPAMACQPPPLLLAGLQRKPIEVLKAADYLAVYESAEDILNITPDFDLLKQLDCRAVIVTAPGKNSDFVSRFFAPGLGIDEDPVTGSSHTTLIPFWAERLKKKKLHAMQLSKRTGELFCEYLGERVLISGRAVTYMVGEIVL